MKVYVVDGSSGCSSDRHLSAIFSTVAKAQEYIIAMSNPNRKSGQSLYDAGFQEYELDPEVLL